METIKPKNAKFTKELYFNPTAALVFAGLFLLNIFDIFIIIDNYYLQILFAGLFLILALVFMFKTIINLFYKIKIAETFITFIEPLKLAKKSIAYTTISDYRFKSNKTKNDTLVFFLKTGEVVSVDLSRYADEQKKYLLKIIAENKV